jgi:hypothetical protein
MVWLSPMHAYFGKEKLAREHEEELQFHLSLRERLNVSREGGSWKPVTTPNAVSAIRVCGESGWAR